MMLLLLLLLLLLILGNVDDGWDPCKRMQAIARDLVWRGWENGGLTNGRPWTARFEVGRTRIKEPRGSCELTSPLTVLAVDLEIPVY